MCYHNIYKVVYETVPKRRHHIFCAVDRRKPSSLLPNEIIWRDGLIIDHICRKVVRKCSVDSVDFHFTMATLSGRNYHKFVT